MTGPFHTADHGSRGFMALRGQSLLPLALMGLVAVAIPSIILGRSVVGIALVLALLLVPFLDRRSESWELARRVFRSPAAVLVGLVAVAWLPSLLASLDPGRSFFAEFRTFLYFAGGVVVWAAMRVERGREEVAYKLLLAVTAVLLAIGFVGFFVSSEFLQLFRGHGWTEYSPRRSLKESASSAVLLMPIVMLIGYRLRGSWRLLSVAVIVGLLLLVYLTANRSAMAGVLCATLVAVALIAMHSQQRRPPAAVAVATMLLGFVAWGLDHYQYPPGSYPDAQLTPIPYWLIDPPRQAIWLNAWEAGEPYRLFGAGINVIDRLPGADEWNEMTHTRTIPLHPHNWAVEIVVETGIVGFAAMLLALVYLSLRLVRAYLRTGDLAVLAAIYVWIAYWTIGLFSVSYWSSWWQVSFVAAMAFSLAVRADDDKTARRLPAAGSA